MLVSKNPTVYAVSSDPAVHAEESPNETAIPKLKTEAATLQERAEETNVLCCRPPDFSSGFLCLMQKHQENTRHTAMF